MIYRNVIINPGLTPVRIEPEHIEHVCYIFDDPLIAQSMIKTLNSKSDISHDIDSIKMLNEQVKNIWPFPT